MGCDPSADEVPARPDADPLRELGLLVRCEDVRRKLASESQAVLAGLERRREGWVDFMMRFELDLAEPDPSRAWKSALTIGASYAVGGMIPLAPYFFVTAARQGLIVSVAVTLVALAVFGFFKGRMTGARPLRAARTVLIGGVASAAAFALARLVA
jgi:vacuolar iron transporter family protein